MICILSIIMIAVLGYIGFILQDILDTLRKIYKEIRIAEQTMYKQSKKKV